MSRTLGLPPGTYRVTDGTVVVVGEGGVVMQQLSREAWEQTAQASLQSYDDLLLIPEQISPDDPRLAKVQWRSVSAGQEVGHIGLDLVVVRGVQANVVLAFTRAEWKAFVAGAKDGQFDK